MRAIVLGSGLSSFSEHFEILKFENFESQVGVNYKQLDGHERRFLWCKHLEETFLIISGKLHFYEGFSLLELIKPIQYAIEELGVDEIVITSASGGLSANRKVGEWIYIDQLMSVPHVNIKIIPSNGKQLVAKQGGQHFDFYGLSRGTYAYHQGPSLGTLAEYKMLHKLGADLVGMSMYPEFNYLNSVGINSHFLSIPVCNYHPFEHVEEPTFEQVIEVSSLCIPKLVELFSSYLLHSKN